jgi:BioD-like phosphotransacetylase family protein
MYTRPHDLVPRPARRLHRVAAGQGAWEDTVATLYITSNESFSGKSALSIGLARRFRQDGLRIGYMKPLGTASHLGTDVVDEDAAFFRLHFALPDSLEDMVPIRLGEEAVEQILRGQPEPDPAGRLRSAFARIAQGRDVVLLEGGANLREGALVGLPAARVADLLDAREIAIVKYADRLQVLDDSLAAMEGLGAPLVGVVLNSVPRPHMPFVQDLVRPALEKRGVRVLAVLPQERLLQSLSVAELVELLEGEVICGKERLDELVEHLMVGAMGVESALAYFRRKPNKAVITGGDRSDIQLAALETSTRCLILTGNLRPSPIIVGRAEEVGIPMIVVRQDTLTTVETVERYFGKTRFHQDQKIERFEEMLADRFDFDALYAALSLPSPAAGAG